MTSGGDLVPFVEGGGRVFPQCVRCGRDVEEVDFRYETYTASSWAGPPTIVYSGYAIVTVRCHGEVWKERIFSPYLLDLP